MQNTFLNLVFKEHDRQPCVLYLVYRKPSRNDYTTQELLLLSIRLQNCSFYNHLLFDRTDSCRRSNWLLVSDRNDLQSNWLATVQKPPNRIVNSNLVGCKKFWEVNVSYCMKSKCYFVLLSISNLQDLIDIIIATRSRETFGKGLNLSKKNFRKRLTADLACGLFILAFPWYQKLEYLRRKSFALSICETARGF